MHYSDQEQNGASRVYSNSHFSVGAGTARPRFGSSERSTPAGTSRPRPDGKCI